MKEMTSLERRMAVLARGRPDRVPVIPQAFLFACETAGWRIGEINRDGRKLAKSHEICQEKYGYDGRVIDVDDATLAEACGAKVHYRRDDVGAVDENQPLLSDIREIHDLEPPDPLKSGRLPVWLEATRTLADAIGDRVFIMGRADQGPFDLLCLLRGAQNMMMDLLTEDPAEIARALEWCAEAVLRFARAQQAAGAHATSIGDAYAGPDLISPALYRQFAWEPERRLAAAMKSAGMPFSVHICGDATTILEDMVQTGAAILELDWKVDMRKASRVVGDRAVLMGNVNPSEPLVIGTPDQVDAAARAVIAATGGRNLILSSGCALGRNTPAENLKALVDAARKYGRLEETES